MFFQVSLPIVDQDSNSCRRSDRLNTGDKKFCAGGETGKDSCNGDSGGPAVVQQFAGSQMIQVGVVSFGSSVCGSSQRAGVYTKVADFLPWIEQNLEP